jgi:hypothetical protein
MTEIKIEKKKPMALWLIAASVVLAALLYWYFSPKTEQYEKAEESTNSIERTTPDEKDNAVAIYISFVSDDADKMGLDHEYTHGAILKLINAIEATADDIGYEVKADLSKAREHANDITIDPFETTHAKSIRKAADICITSLVNMQQAKYPSLVAEATEIKQAAAAINPDVLTLNQKEAVKTFFRKAADLLSKMN